MGVLDGILEDIAKDIGRGVGRGGRRTAEDVIDDMYETRDERARREAREAREAEKARRAQRQEERTQERAEDKEYDERKDLIEDKYDDIEDRLKDAKRDVKTEYSTELKELTNRQNQLSRDLRDDLISREDYNIGAAEIRQARQDALDTYKEGLKDIKDAEAEADTKKAEELQKLEEEYRSPKTASLDTTDYDTGVTDNPMAPVTEQYRSEYAVIASNEYTVAQLAPSLGNEGAVLQQSALKGIDVTELNQLRDGSGQSFEDTGPSTAMTMTV